MRTKTILYLLVKCFLRWLMSLICEWIVCRGWRILDWMVITKSSWLHVIFGQLFCFQQLLYGDFQLTAPLRKLRQEGLSEARFSHVSTRISKLFRVILRLSLKQSLGRSTRHIPWASSPYSSTLRIHTSSMHWIFPVHRAWVFSRRVCMQGMLARESTSVSGIWSCHLIFSSLRRQEAWK